MTANNKTVKPLYPSKNYRDFCKYQKQKGLSRRFWKDLPQMGEKQLEFRKELEECLNH